MGIAHLGHVELATPNLQASKEFFTETMGLYVSAETTDQIYLRAWQDFEHHTLILTHKEHAGVLHIAWRVEENEDLERFQELFAKQHVPHEWIKEGKEIGQGRALRFTTPSYHIMELYNDMKQAVIPTELGSPLLSHPQRFTGKGLAPRRIDHITIVADDADGLQQWLSNVLGMKLRYFETDDEGRLVSAWMSRTPLTHEIAIMTNRNDKGPLLHHVAYSVDSPDEVIRGARILVDSGTRIEYGPGMHGTSGGFFLYFKEPSGNRMEIWSGGMLIFTPDWKPQRWTPDLFRLYGSNMFGASPPPEFILGI